MQKIAVITPTGFEDIELIATLDILKRAQIEYELFSNENKTIVYGSANAMVKTVPLTKIELNKYTGLFLPGGPGVQIMINDHLVLKTIKHFYDENKYIFAICAAPSLLKKLNILNNTKHTAYPGFELSNTYLKKAVVKDKNIITANGPNAAIAFSLKIVETLCGINKLIAVKKAIIFD